MIGNTNRGCFITITKKTFFLLALQFLLAALFLLIKLHVEDTKEKN